MEKPYFFIRTRNFTGNQWSDYLNPLCWTLLTPALSFSPGFLFHEAATNSPASSAPYLLASSARSSVPSMYRL